MTSTPAKISVQHVTKTFSLGRETFTALDDVSLDIANHEFVTVVGPRAAARAP